MKDDSPTSLGPLADVWTLVSAFNDAMNLRHLRGELYGESADLVAPHRAPPRLGDSERTRSTPSFDPRLAYAYAGLRRGRVDHVQTARKDRGA